ncbi:unnamed protein product [Nezara viridula]|uniref:Dystrophin n=1 Tax=Nezara viridula TaxID=85310 RepID=A0A9P0MQ22_NEZVI|nr:unnamed protein product [Nezara viridula]
MLSKHGVVNELGCPIVRRDMPPLVAISERAPLLTTATGGQRNLSEWVGSCQRIRNRLESNAEHWNALLLSLRELIEWVIRKDTELSSLSVMSADINSLIKLQDDHRAFRRQLEDKKPVIESNLLSGRQYVASEPPLSDTSDTEGDARYGNAEARELTRCIRREVNKLSDKWNALIDRSARWHDTLDDTLTALQPISEGSHPLLVSVVSYPLRVPHSLHYPLTIGYSHRSFGLPVLVPPIFL